MRSPAFYLKKRSQEPWIIGEGSSNFSHYIQQGLVEIKTFTDAGTLPIILIAEAEPIRFLAKFLAAIATGSPVFLANYQWQKNEWEKVFSLVKPNIVWGLPNRGVSTYKSASNWRNCIMIPTGGSSGEIRFAIHTWDTLSASAMGFCEYFQTDKVNSFCTLPVHHVSGLMQFVRSLITGGKLFVCPFKKLNLAKLNELDIADFFISLVPTQLEKVISTDPQSLSKFKTVLLGGAPAWKELLDTSRSHEIRVALTYGMTETASQIVALKPEEFIAGNSSNGKVLPHAEISLRDRVINIKSKSLYLGYYPNLLATEERMLETDDLGYFDDNGYLYILGRNSQKIISGGENIFPAEVEAAIRATNLVKDVCVIGLEDNYWGQVVTAIYIPATEDITGDAIASLLHSKIAKFKHPKHWIPVTSIPRNLQGKVDNKMLVNIAVEFINETLK